MTPLKAQGDLDDELDEIAALATPLNDSADLDPLLGHIGDARFVLLGEASHGTAEYYWWRADITRRLAVEHGFSFVAVEGDWPACFDVNRWVKGRGDQADSACQVLDAFERWPRWMWANEEVADFADWLREHNRLSARKVYHPGLDRHGNWVSTVMGQRYDAFCTFDDTEALDPPQQTPAGAAGEEETFPWGT